MPIKDPKEFIFVIPVYHPIRVKYKDIFDLGELYKSLREWLLDHEWQDEEDGLDHWENYYGERISQNGAREIWIQWRPRKKNKDDSRLVYYLDFDWHCLAITSTEVIKDGQKFKANKGEVELKIRAYIEKVYEKEWKNHPLLKNFTGIFTRRIYKSTLEQKEKELYQEAYALQNFIKQWFKLKRYLPYEEAKAFYSPKAWPSHIKS